MRHNGWTDTFAADCIATATVRSGKYAFRIQRRRLYRSIMAGFVGFIFNACDQATVTSPSGLPTSTIISITINSSTAHMSSLYTPVPSIGYMNVPVRSFYIAKGNRGAGVPGIMPQIATTSLGVPAYGEQDVRYYLLTNPPRGWGVTITPTLGYTVDTIVLMQIRDFNQVYSTQTMFRPDTLVYVAEMAGRFTLSGGPAPGLIGTFPICVAVFDARTGDVLIEGGLER